MDKKEIRSVAKASGFPKDEETLSIWFYSLYARDFDHDEDGYHTGQDTKHGHDLASAVKQALR